MEGTLYQGSLGVHFAAFLFDAVIFNLLNKNSAGLAVHAGAVSFGDNVILLPGQSGNGKSSLTACLVANGYSYLTDELYFFPVDSHAPCLSFTRPLCIKSGAATAIRQLVTDPVLEKAITDENGCLIPHRLLNPDFHPQTISPSLILVPQYRAGAALAIEKMSAAQVSTQLMSCDVNGRNLEDHGFTQVVQIARSTPAYQVTYSSFSGVGDAMEQLLEDLHWT